MSDARNRDIKDVLSDQTAVIGEMDHEVQRARPDEGVRAPFAEETGGPVEYSVFDGHGNEAVAVETDEGGRRTIGTGETREDALKDARDQSELIGEGFFPPE
jgi:hypothetical protein